jgi:glycine cleavage system H protein
VNESPYEDGWMIRVRLAKPEELDTLMDSTAYQGLLAEA